MQNQLRGGVAGVLSICDLRTDDGDGARRASLWRVAAGSYGLPVRGSSTLPPPACDSNVKQPGLLSGLIGLVGGEGRQCSQSNGVALVRYRDTSVAGMPHANKGCGDTRRDMVNNRLAVLRCVDTAAGATRC